MSEPTILDQLAIFHVDFDIWSGKARLTARDFRLGTDGEIPPATLATLGSKKICDPQLLKDFAAIKQRMIRFMERVGMRFMNGYAVPLKRLDEVSAELNKLKSEFYMARNRFLTQYDQAVDDWCANNPDWAQIIRDGVLSRDDVEDKLGMTWEAFQVTNGAVQASGTMGVENKALQLGGELMKEVVSTAADAYSTHLAKGKGLKVSYRIRTPLATMRQKIDGLSFLDSRFSSLVDLMDEALRFFPEGSREPVEGEGYFRISAVVQILSDAGKVDDYVRGDTTIDSLASRIEANTPADQKRTAAHAGRKQVTQQPDDDSFDASDLFADLDADLGIDGLDAEFEDAFGTFVPVDTSQATPVSRQSAAPGNLMASGSGYF